MTTTHFKRSIPTGHIFFLFDDACFFFEKSHFSKFAEILEGFPRGVTVLVSRNFQIYHTIIKCTTLFSILLRSSLIIPRYSKWCAVVRSIVHVRKDLRIRDEVSGQKQISTRATRSDRFQGMYTRHRWDWDHRINHRPQNVAKRFGFIGISSKNYLHRLKCRAISTIWRRKSVYICQRDIMSTKPNTLVEDRGPPNSRRSSKNYLHRLEYGAISTSWRRKSVYICHRDIMSTKPNTPVKDRGPPYSRRNSKNYLHRLECGAISTSWCRKSVYICQRDIISTKLDTLDRDRGPSNFRRSSKNCLPRFNFDVTSTSGYNTLMSRSCQSITRCKNLISETLVEGYTSTIESRRRSAKSTVHVLEYSRRVGVLYT